MSKSTKKKKISLQESSESKHDGRVSVKSSSGKKSQNSGTKSFKLQGGSKKHSKDDKSSLQKAHQYESKMGLPLQNNFIAIVPTSKSSHKSSSHQKSSQDTRLGLFGSKVKYQESQGFSPSLTKSADALGKTGSVVNCTEVTSAVKVSTSDTAFVSQSSNPSITTKYNGGGSSKKKKSSAVVNTTLLPRKSRVL